MTLTPADIDAMEVLEKKARVSFNLTVPEDLVPWFEYAKASRQFIPRAISELRRLQAEVASWEEYHTSCSEPGGWCPEAGAAIARLQAENAVMREALNKIEGQAVCFNMDGDEGNERMLRHIVDLARRALSEGGEDAAKSAIEGNGE